MYCAFNSFFVRTPYFPFKFLKEEFFETAIRNSYFQESIYIASPILYAELQKILSGKSMNFKERERIESALYRYLSRMSSRCTPFGLFAGLSFGSLTNDKTKIVMGDTKRYTRLSMHFLCILSQELSMLSGIKDNIKYYPNCTLFQAGKQYRYVESQYIKNRRCLQLVSMNRSFYIDAILKISKKGIKINQILDYLTENNVKYDEALEFVEDLIKHQILISELTPSVAGDDFFTKLICVLDEIKSNISLVSNLKNIQKMLHSLDLTQKDHTELYKNIIQEVKKTKIPYDENFLFHVDIMRNIGDSTLDKNIVDELQSTMIFLNKISSEKKNEILDQFKQTFYRRYEDREVSLLEALDSEFGIGYPINGCTGNVSTLLENFYFPNKNNQRMNVQTNAFLSVLLKKTIDAYKESRKEIVLYDSDFNEIMSDLEGLPSTLYSIFNILKTDSDKYLIHLDGFYGISGAKALTRFAYTDIKINEIVNEITVKEQELQPNAILAEIIHLPDPKIGNVLSRPHIRDYEIPYIANSDLSEDKIIYLSDIFLSIRKGEIFLRSKKLNKEIIPRLTNTHNYIKSLLPIYRFLCDVQLQHGKKFLSFNWGDLDNELSFLPRVSYKNTILALATWKVKTEEIRHLFKIEDNCELINEIKKWRKKISLPLKVLLIDFDNELLVDWENIRSIRAFFSIINKRDVIILKEFLYDSEMSVVKDKNGGTYPNECIIVFYKSKKQ